MGDYLFSDVKGPNLEHPDSAIRLASVVHRFRLPKIARQVNFVRSFNSVGSNNKTRKLMVGANDARDRLFEALSAGKLSAERVMNDSERYQPMIHSVLLSCKVQPEQARLDERLVFEWKSGIEGKPTAFKSEAMMYDFVMTVVCQGLGNATLSTEKSVAGDFAAASRGYAAAAGIFDNLAQEHLPKWISKGSNVDEDSLPLECQPEIAAALKTLFMANGQQMAVATLLMKEGKPNEGLVAKLCLGIAELLEDFVSQTRRAGADVLARMDTDFFGLIALEVAVQKSLSLYFQARMLWTDQRHGLAIGMLSEAGVALRQRESAGAEGVPDISKSTALRPLMDDLKDLRSHMALLLRSWEKDNSSVYFESVPQRVPASEKIQEGIQMKKMAPFELKEAEPVLLALPKDKMMKRTDSDLARELQARLNMEG